MTSNIIGMLLFVLIDYILCQTLFREEMKSILDYILEKLKKLSR